MPSLRGIRPKDPGEKISIYEFTLDPISIRRFGGVGNYPSIPKVCEIATKVFIAENKTWKVRSAGAISLQEVINSYGEEGISLIAADCRALVVHVITRHVPVHNPLEKEDQLYATKHIAKWMGDVSSKAIQKARKRACGMLERYDYGSIYYAILQELIAQGFDLWCLPKDLYQPKRA